MLDASPSRPGTPSLPPHAPLLLPRSPGAARFLLNPSGPLLESATNRGISPAAREPVTQWTGMMSNSSTDFPGRLPNQDAAAASPPAVAGYQVLGLLGRGGMGVVYKARQDSLDRFVALKFLSETCARDPVWMARFRREARTASALNHPHICTIYDTGESDERPFLSMELIEGRTLETLIGRPVPTPELARLLGQAARALAAAHAAGVVHRDLKPANLMVRD